MVKGKQLPTVLLGDLNFPEKASWRSPVISDEQLFVTYNDSSLMILQKHSASILQADTTKPNIKIIKAISDRQV